MDERITPPPIEVYATRASVFEPQTEWRLTRDSLVRERRGEPPNAGVRRAVEIAWRILFPWARPLTTDNWPDEMDYDRISSIRLRFDPTRFDRGRMRCDLRAAGGARVSFFSTRYVGPGQFEDRTAEYRPFVDELVRRVIAARPDVPVHSGLSWTSYLVQHGIVLASFTLLAAAIGLAGLPASGTIWVKLLIIVSYMGTAWAYTRRNLPRRLNPPSR